MRIAQKLYDLFQKQGRDFIQAVFLELAGRQPSESEVQLYLPRTNEPERKITMIINVLKMPECQNQYDQPLQKVNKNHSSIPTILRSFYRASEALFVQSLYREILCREFDKAGYENFMSFLGGGGSREMLMATVLVSDECLALLNSGHRPCEQALDSTKVSFVIPTFNQVDLIKQCIQSLKPTIAGKNYEILVIDDGSEAGIQQQLLAWGAQENVRVIAKPENQGFSRSVNEGIQAATGRYIMLVNNDILFNQPEWLDHMLNTMKSSPDIGIAGARLLYPDLTIQHGGMVFENNCFQHRYRHMPGDLQQAKSVEDNVALTGALFLIEQKLVQDIGLFSEEYFTAYEDVDFCYRARLKGWRVVYCGAAAAIHLEGKTRGNKSQNNFYEMKEFEARTRFERKWSGYHTIL